MLILCSPTPGLTNAAGAAAPAAAPGKIIAPELVGARGAVSAALGVVTGAVVEVGAVIGGGVVVGVVLCGGIVAEVLLVALVVLVSVKTLFDEGVVKLLFSVVALFLGAPCGLN